MEVLVEAREFIEKTNWFVDVDNSAFDDWPGPEHPFVERLGYKTQELVDYLASNGLQVQSELVSEANELLADVGKLKGIVFDEDIYNAEYFSYWIAVWLLSAVTIYEKYNYEIPNWVNAVLGEYRNGSWPWGIDENLSLVVA
jgi:hypothetical protein